MNFTWPLILTRLQLALRSICELPSGHECFDILIVKPLSAFTGCETNCLNRSKCQCKYCVILGNCNKARTGKTEHKFNNSSD